jgi:hypothetical protein
MSNVIGPIDRAGWITLRNLKKTMKFMGEDSKRYQAIIKKEKELFNYLLTKYSKAA